MGFPAKDNEVNFGKFFISFAEICFKRLRLRSKICRLANEAFPISFNWHIARLR